MSLDGFTTTELLAELAKRGALPRCRCKKWSTYVGAYDEDGHTLRCSGCLRATVKCAC